MTKFKIKKPKNEEEAMIYDKEWQNPIKLNKENNWTTPDILDKITIDRLKKTVGFYEVKKKPTPR